MELLTVVAIVAVLAGLLLAVLGRARSSARMAQSIGNLRVIGGAINGFLQDNRQRFPSMGTDMYLTPPRWSTRIAPYGLPVAGLAPDGSDVGSDALLSPFVNTHADSSDYGASSSVFSWPWTVPYNKRTQGFGISYLSISSPARLVMVASCGYVTGSTIGGRAYFLAGQTPPGVTDWNSGAVQALFADGHVEAIPTQKFFADNYLSVAP